MIVDYTKGIYHIYLNKLRIKPEDELHIFSDNISDIKEYFIEFVKYRWNKFFLIKQFDKLIIECVREQLKEYKNCD